VSTELAEEKKEQAVMTVRTACFSAIESQQLEQQVVAVQQ